MRMLLHHQLTPKYPRRGVDGRYFSTVPRTDAIFENLFRLFIIKLRRFHFCPFGFSNLPVAKTAAGKPSLL